jgi:hypothetical protein
MKAVQGVKWAGVQLGAKQGNLEIFKKLMPRTHLLVDSVE